MTAICVVWMLCLHFMLAYIQLVPHKSSGQMQTLTYIWLSTNLVLHYHDCLSQPVLSMQTALEEAVVDGDAAKKLLQMERDSTALLAKAREAAVEVWLPPCVQLPYQPQLCLEAIGLCSTFMRVEHG